METGDTKMIRKYKWLAALLGFALATSASAADTTPYSAASKTFQIAVSNVSSTPVQIVPNNPNFQGCVQYLFSNTGAQDVWVETGSASAGTTAVAATTVTPSTSFLVPAGASQMRTSFQNAWIAAITASSTSTLNVSCGTGSLYAGTTSSSGGGSVTASQGTPAATADAWPVKITDGTDTANVTTGGSLQAEGNVASAATDSGAPVKVGGKYNTTPPAFTDGQRGDLQISAQGALQIAGNSNAATDDTSNTLATLGVQTSNGLRLLGVAIHCFDGSTWDRCRTASIGNNVAATGIYADAPYGQYLNNANQPAITTGNYGALQFAPDGALRTTGQRPATGDILDGYATVTATTATTTLVTVSAGRTWIGQICASVDGNKAAAATGNGLVNATFLTTGTNVTPAAGTYFGVAGSIGANAATGTVGTQISNQGCSTFTTTAPAGNSTTINYVTTCTNTTACAIHVSAIGNMQ